MSVASIARLKAKWQAEYEEWKKQYLSSLQVVSQWAGTCKQDWKKARRRFW
jgi:hypothetical protein